MGLFKSNQIKTIKQGAEYGHKCVNELYDNAIQIAKSGIYPDNFITNFYKMLLYDRKDWQLDTYNNFIYKGVAKIQTIDVEGIEDLITRIIAIELRFLIKDSSIIVGSVLSGIVEAKKTSRNRMATLPFKVEGHYPTLMINILSQDDIFNVMNDNLQFELHTKGMVYLSRIIISENILIELMDIKDNADKIEELKKFLESTKSMFSSEIFGNGNKVINDL